MSQDAARPRRSPDAGFEDLAFLFACENRNRCILRMNFDEAALLWKAARATHGDVLEVGRRYGGSTVLLATAASDRQVTSVDLAPEHHPVAEAFFARPENARRLRLLVGNSRAPMKDRAFGFALIDGDHTSEGVLADVEAHWPSLRGVAPVLCAFHDALPNTGLRPDLGPEAIADAARRHVDDSRLTNHFIGIECLCRELVDAGVATVWGEAGSMQVLTKIGELPADFGTNVRRRLAGWTTPAGA